MKTFKRLTDGKIFKWQKCDSQTVLYALQEKANFEEIFEEEKQEEIIEFKTEEVIEEIKETPKKNNNKRKGAGEK